MKLGDKIYVSNFSTEEAIKAKRVRYYSGTSNWMCTILCFEHKNNYDNRESWEYAVLVDNQEVEGV